MKKKIAIPIAIILLCLITLYFIAPGMMLGDIRHINADSHIRVAVMSHTRVQHNFGGSDVYVFESGWQEVIVLDEVQAAELRDLLRGSWYTRRLGHHTVQMYNVPPDVVRYYTFTISVFDDDGLPISIDIGWNGVVWRDNHAGSRLRILGDWEGALRAILWD